MHGLCVVALAACIGGLSLPEGAEQDNPPIPLPAEVVAAWQKAGGEVGWIGRNEFGSLAFRLGDKGETRVCAGF